ncbi:hypothetical protein [Mycolicibacterium sphagni]|uniref:Uncharacterized protein n=1 Tax=Mycolicibacterium sphagni TaxID=1786 RepID=A0ABX2K512_9MYCO|nr:hypothetical protein [Mycolicibacterium sphagni]NTY62188.1 hypothetical protein [Mycolicibacterium sphagni]
MPSVVRARFRAPGVAVAVHVGVLAALVVLTTAALGAHDVEQSPCTGHAYVGDDEMCCLEIGVVGLAVATLVDLDDAVSTADGL